MASAKASAQAIPLRDGFAATTLVRSSGAAWRQRGLGAGLSGDDVYFARANELLHQRGQSAPTSLGFSPTGGDIGFVVRPRGSTRLFYSEFGTGVVLARDLLSGHVSAIGSLQNAFDLDVTGDGTVLIVANPDWPQPNANTAIFAFASSTTPLRLLQLVGPSGPIAILPSGDVLVAELGAITPPTPGSVSILRVSAAQVRAAIATRQSVSRGSVGVFASGLDGAYDLAVDDRGAVYVSDSIAGDVRRIEPDGRIDPTRLVARHSRSALDLVFQDEGVASFLPRQRADAGVLWCAVSDFSTSAEIVAIRPQPPTLTSPQAPAVPRGVARIDASGLPPSSSSWLLVSALPPRPPWHALTFRHVDLFTSLDPLIPPWIAPLAIDGTGAGTFTFQHRGGATSIALTLEAWSLPTLDAEPAAISSPLSLILLP